MVTRTQTVTVEFRRPFVLAGFEKMQPAGSYIVDTEEEQLDSQSVIAWRRVATNIRVPQGIATEHIAVDPNALHEALMRDGAQEHSGEVAKMRHDRARGGLFRTLSRLRPKKL